VPRAVAKAEGAYSMKVDPTFAESAIRASKADPSHSMSLLEKASATAGASPISFYQLWEE
jgi:hypothetical protein